MPACSSCGVKVKKKNGCKRYVCEDCKARQTRVRNNRKQTDLFICGRCERTSEQTRFGAIHTECLECSAKRKNVHYHTKGKETRNTEQGKRIQAEANKRYLNTEQGKQKRIEYNNGETSKLVRIKYQQSEQGKKTLNETRKRYDKKNPEKTKARNKVKYALRTKKLERPLKCSLCGSSRGKIEAHHHKGYKEEYALDIQWLCKCCHTKAHNK